MRRILLRNLFSRPLTEAIAPDTPGSVVEATEALQGAVLRRLGRSLAIRQVDAGSCNGCELEIQALNNPYYDLERFGIRFVASPRHADLLLVTGPVTHNMRVALERVYTATPAPKWVVATGDCAAGCGVFADSEVCVGSVARVLPVDLVLRGCPPSPLDLIRGLRVLLERDPGGPTQTRAAP